VNGGRSSEPNAGRWARTVIVGLTLLIPLIAVAFALRSEQPTDGATAATTEVGAAATVNQGDSQPEPNVGTTTAPTTSETTATTATTEVTPPITTSDQLPQLQTDAVMRQDSTLTASPGGTTGSELGQGQEVEFTGAIREVDGSTWFEAATGNETGWVPAVDLALTTTNFDVRSCSELPNTAAADPLAYSPGAADDDPDGVIAIETHVAADCTRTVLLLGSFSEGRLADAFPADLDLVDFGGLLRLDIPDADHATELEFIELDDGAIAITATRGEDIHALYIDRGPSRVAVAFLASPARIVIDSAPTTDFRPSSGGGVAISSQTIADAAVAGDGSTIVVRGWARPVGGLGQIAFRNAPAEGAAPESGLAYNVTFSGTSSVGQVERSWYFYRTATAGGVWSDFQFEISGLEPGSYEMFLGLGDRELPEGVTEPGIFQILEVGTP